MAIYSAVWRDDSGIRPREVIGPVGSLTECANWLGAQPRVSGPNGPATSKVLYRDGREVGIWEELRAAGLTALVRLDPFGREVFAGVASADV